MTQEEVAAAIVRGEQILCTRAEWPVIRSRLQYQSDKWLRMNDVTHAAAALVEVERLNAAFAYTIQDNGMTA